MLKYFRRNRKKLLAVFGALLMVVFILPSTATNFGKNDTLYATLGGRKVYSSEVFQAKKEWDALKRLYVRQKVTPLVGGMPPQDQVVPVIYQLGATMADPFRGGLLNYAVRQIDQQPELYYLLYEDALRTGTSVSAEQVEAAMQQIQTPGGPLNLSDPETAYPLRTQVQRFLTVKAAFDRAADSIKISQPYREQALASALQSIKVNLVEFDARSLASSTTAPAADELAEQLKTYAGQNPGTDQNAFGFGYRYPNRVKLQYIAVPYEDVEKAVLASRSDYDWEKEQWKYYLSHQQEFQTLEAAPPTTSPLTLGAALPQEAVQPTSRPTTKPFEQVRDDVKSRIVRPEVQKLAGDISNRIMSAMAADWSAYQRAQLSTGAATAPAAAAPVSSAVGVPYDSPEYLPRLALEIQKRYGVLPKTTSLHDQFRSEAQLAEQPGIGSAYAGNFPFAVYAIESAEPFLPQAQRELSTTLSLFEPSQPLRDPSGSSYFFRLTAADPAHNPASAEEVADKLAADVQLKQSFEQAKQSAAAFLQTAQSRGLQEAAEAAGKKVLTTGSFSSRSDAQSIRDCPVSQASGRTFIAEAFKLLNDAAAANNLHAMRLIELPRDGKVLVAQLQEVTPAWSREYAGIVESRINEQLADQFRMELEQSWFDYEALANRLQYVLLHPPQQKTTGGAEPEQPPPPPMPKL